MLAKYFISIAVFLIGAAALVIPSGYSLGFYLLSFVGFGVWIKHRQPLVPEEARCFFLPLLAYALGQMILAFHEKWALRELANCVPFALVLFGVWVVRYYKPKAEWYWMGLAVGAVGAAALAGYQSINLGVRPGGHTHPIQFGNIALLMGVLCLVRAIVNPVINGFNLCMWVGFISGLIASVWSQTRGGWIALGFILIWILVNLGRKWPRGKLALVSSVIIFITMIPVFQEDSLVLKRISEAVSDVDSFIVDNKQDTSVGIRLAMWGVAVDGIKDAPLIGHGKEGWVEVRDKAIHDGRLSNFAAGLSHIHNEYIDVVFKRGFLGLALLLSMYFIPMFFYFRPHLNDDRKSVRALSMAGMVVPMMYMDFGLSQVFLSHNSGRIVFVGFWMCIAALMSNAIDKGFGDI